MTVAPRVVDNDDQLKKKTTEVSHCSLLILCRVLLTRNTTVTESQNIIHHQARKENRLEKQKKKALKATYQNNPKVFEKEPSELLSDVDKEEDTMV